MPTSLKSSQRSWTVLVASVLVCVGVWRWAETILVPANTVKVLAAHRPIGNNSDLYPRWLGAQELLLHERDPYSLQVTRDIQTGFYGRPLDPENPSDPKAQESFVYPLYVVFILAPTVTLPFPMVAEIFRWILLSSIALSVPLWMYAIGIRASWQVVASAMLLAVSSNPGIAEYSQQNLAALALLFVAAAVAAVVGHRLILSGCFLALATIKPDITLPVVFWLVLWAAASKARRRLLWAFAISMTILFAGAQAISPGWLWRFFSAVREYPSYGTDPSILQVLFPRLVANLALALLVVLVCVLCWRWKEEQADSALFGWALALVAAVTVVAIPKLAAYNQLLLIPALLVLLRHQRGAGGLLARAFTKGAFACQIWQWSAAAVLAIFSIGIARQHLFALAHLPLYTWLALPPMTLLAALASMAELFRRSPLPGSRKD